MNKKRIVVVGGTGFIGQYLIRLYGDKYSFIVPTSKMELSSLCDKAQYFYVSYEENAYYSLFSGCEGVILLGGKVMRSMDYDMSPAKYTINLEICEKVFEACRLNKISNVVFTSSVAVYDQKNDNPMNEEAYCQPNSMYGVIKIAAEKMAEIYNRRYSMKIKILRIAQVFGVHSALSDKSFWDSLLLNCVNGNKICIYGRGVTGRDIIYVKDVAEALVAAIENEEAVGIYNIGSGYIASNREIAETYCRVFGNDAGIVFDESAFETGIRTCMDCEKAFEQLGFRAKYDLELMVKDIYLEYKRRL